MPDAPLPSWTDPDRAATASGVRWQLRLLGAVQARSGQQLLQRWPSRAAAALLARLALAPDNIHPREALIEQLWPGVALAVGRNRLRQTLSTLRALLEPPGPGLQPVLQADRHSLRRHAQRGVRRLQRQGGARAHH